MKHVTLIALASAAPILIPRMIADVGAGFSGPVDVEQATGNKVFALTAWHLSKLVDIPDMGQGLHFTDGANIGSCIFTNVMRCTSGGYSGTQPPGTCSLLLKATSDSLLVGGYASTSTRICN